jgi:hypothetical protein
VLGAKLTHFHFKKAPSSELNCPREKTCEVVSIGLVSVGVLAEAKRTAFGRRVWFRALTRIERGIVDLTLRYVDDIKSTKLAKVLTAIIEKLQQATESVAERLVRTVGFPLAQKISSIAVSWGNLSAAKWAGDSGFAGYLAVCVLKDGSSKPWRS